MDPFTLAAGAAAVAGLGAAWRMCSRARCAEAEVIRLREELRAERHAASHDPLTGLPNRRAFYQIGAALVADPGRPPLVAVMLDLDGFKQINDRFGHAVGDQVLIAVAWRFAAYAGDNLIARLGGDEFAGLLVSGRQDGRWLHQSARRLAEMLAAPIRVADANLRVTASVGLAPVDTGTHLAEVLDIADAAMYRVKTGRGFGALDDGQTLPDLDAAAQPTRFGLGAGHLSQPKHPGRRRSAQPTPSRQLIETTPGAEPGGQ
ncbi:GGDEF domain-containing protein [Plantactinospora sp. CA-290183]|uniref:GGDEF domain-containing protein n=1 Tax=Plantactinospora sp. CA-290183 TaxID=3240006 RepID=UPI003D93590A